MRYETHAKILAVSAAAVLAVVAFAVIYEVRDTDEIPDIDMVGDWYLVSCQSYDVATKLYTNVKDDANISVKGSAFDGTVFYGNIMVDRSFEGGIGFSGIYADDSVMYHYETDEGTVRAIGKVTPDGNLRVVEAHFYMKIQNPFWFVSVNTYSKDPRFVQTEFMTPPDINTTWKFWDGQSSRYGIDYPLSGTSLLIYSQNQSFFKGEMEQNYLDGSIVKDLIGVFIGQEGSTYIAYILDETGLAWQAHIGKDSLMLRCVNTTELAEIYGKPVGIERTYRNDNETIGPPQGFDVDNWMVEGRWTAPTINVVYGSGETKVLDADSYSVFDEYHDDIIAGKGVMMGEQTMEMTYAMHCDTIDSGNMFFLIGEYGSFGVRSGYQWLSEDGNTLYRAVFLFNEGKNGVIYYESERA